MARIPSIRLGSTDKTMPLLGFGTAEFPFGVSALLIKESVLHAIKLGCRHFDTAAIYQCEQYLGEAISDALNLGLIESREELFLTSKLWCEDAHADRVVAALTKTLKLIRKANKFLSVNYFSTLLILMFKSCALYIYICRNLKLDYLDLYLIHFPISLKPSSSGPAFPFEKKNLVHMDIESVWRAMEECQTLGLAKSIGVSNFSCKKLETLLTTANIPPAVNQVEMSPLWQQKKLREFCEKKGIHVTAYSPLGGQGTPWGTSQVLENEILKKISEAKGKSVAQICLRWVHEQGVSLVVKSFNKERMKQNVDIFDWALNPEESHLISQIPQRRAFPALQFIHDEGPFGSVEDFWDGEV